MKNIKFMFLFFFSLCLISCASKVSTTVTRPAEINLSKIKNIAVGSFINNNFQSKDRDLSLESKLAIALLNSGRFEKVVERQQISILQKEMDLSLNGATEEDNALSLGKYIGAQAYVYGTIDRRLFSTNLKSEDYKDSKGNTHTKYTREASFECTITFKVINTETTEIITANSISKTINDSLTKEDSRPAYIDSEKLYYEAQDAIIKQFIKMITPQNVQISINLIKDENLPENKIITDLLDGGSQDIALNMLKDATLQNYENRNTLANAYHNYGVVLVILGKFDEGIDYIKKALYINPSEKKYKDALLFANKEKAFNQKYLEQRQ